MTLPQLVSCKAPGCDNTELCDAHIIPRGFARVLSEPKGHNRAIRSDGSKPAKQPHGPFDSHILCGDCDRKLGRFDEYAIGFCGALPMTGTASTGSLFRHEPFDGDQFTLATLAILWRASISEREEWRDVSLGPFESQAGNVLFGLANLSSLRGFEVVLMRYASSDHDARKFIFNPIRIRSGSANVFVMGIGGFQVAAKVDQRPFGSLLRRYIVNGATSLIAPHVRFEETAEFSYFQRVAAADRRRARSYPSHA